MPVQTPPLRPDHRRRRPHPMALDYARAPAAAPPMTIDPALSWSRELAYRMRRHLLPKLVGTTACIWVFFVAYFHLLRHPAFPVTVMPLTALDGLVPIAPLALVPYLSLWFYVGIAPGLQRRFRDLLVYGAWAGALCAVGLAIFWRFPTKIPTFVFDRGGLPGFALLQGIDAPGNACPSMHVAIAMFSAVRLDRLFRECRVPDAARVANWAWFAAIAWSTLAIRQHVVLDAVSGAALGAAFALASLAGRRRPTSAADARAIMAPSNSHEAAGTAIDAGPHGREPEQIMGDAR